MNKYINNIKEAHNILINRYLNKCKEKTKEYKMLKTLLSNLDTFPPDKTSRWIGYIQRILIEKGITFEEIERDFSRPLFHKVYKNCNLNIPKTINVGNSNEK